MCGCLVGTRAKGGPDTGPSRVDRGETGSKHHVLCDGGGIPLVEAIPPVRGRQGKPRRTPDALVADRATTPTHTAMRSDDEGSAR